MTKKSLKMLILLLFILNCNNQGKSSENMALLAILKKSSSSSNCTKTSLKDKKLIIGNCSGKTSIIQREYKDANLDSVEFAEPTNITTIDESAFYGNNLTNIILPEEIKFIGENAFSSNKIKSITIKIENAIGPFFYSHAFENNPIERVFLSKNLFDSLNKRYPNKNFINNIEDYFNRQSNITFCEIDNKNKLKGNGDCKN